MSKSGDNLQIAGGAMYHDAGFAGLPLKMHPQAGLSDKEQNIASGGIREIPDVVDESASLGPSGIASFLLLK